MFDFITTIQDFILTQISPFQSLFTYDSLNGSFYEFQGYILLNMITYILYMIAFVIIIWFVLGLAKVMFYMIQEAF